MRLELRPTAALEALVNEATGQHTCDEDLYGLDYSEDGDCAACDTVVRAEAELDRRDLAVAEEWYADPS